MLDLSKLCADLLARFKALVTKALSAAGGAQGIAAVEVLGGGVRMQVVQAVVQQVVGEHLPLGAKLDDASCALGVLLSHPALSTLSSHPLTPPSFTLDLV